MTTMELIEQGIGHNCLSDAYEKGYVDAIDEFINKFIKRTHLRQMTKAECISTMYDIAYEAKEQKQIE